MRKTIPLMDGWTFQKPGTAVEAITLPHTWNSIDGQDGGNDYWRGTAIYAKRFVSPALGEGERCFIEFKGAAMTAEVIMNGVPVVRHEGGYSTFRADITDHLAPENRLTVTLSNAANDRVYPQMADFTFYGGLYREVALVIVPAEHFELTRDGTPGIKVTPVVDPGRNRAVVTVETWQNASSVTLTVNGESKTVPSLEGHATADFTIENVRLWNGVKDPYLYTATAALPGGDRISARFGCRSFRIDPEKGFFLNGQSYPLRGVSRHQDRKGKGPALSLSDHQEDMAIIREIGANTVRLAHYQHAQEFYDLCDEAGIIVWAEIPYITKHMENGRQNARAQMRELIIQCYNHPSIVCWGLSNEITASSQVTDELLADHRALNDLCHSLDRTRPTAMAHAFMLEKDSPLIPIADLASYNLYFGWYLGELTQNGQFFDEYHALYPDRVIGFSEYGADANVQFHASAPERGDYSEEYQCLYHEHLLRAIEERSYLWSTYVWNLFDFAADGRDEGGKKGENQKGLVTFDRKLRKDAFYLYKAAWSKEPFVHLCGKRYADRAEEQAEVKVYSNMPTVTVYVDGQLLETKAGNRVFTFRVPLFQEHRIVAASGEQRDEMILRRVEQPNPSYFFRKAEIVNWFDKVDCRPDCYSIRDTMGTLSRNPRTAAILNRMMEQLTASRGDVAKGASSNANLQRMMADMTLEGLIKQAGDSVPEAMIRSLNDALQQIKK